MNIYKGTTNFDLFVCCHNFIFPLIMPLYLGRDMVGRMQLLFSKAIFSPSHPIVGFLECFTRKFNPEFQMPLYFFPSFFVYFCFTNDIFFSCFSDFMWPLATLPDGKDFRFIIILHFEFVFCLFSTLRHSYTAASQYN